MKSIVDSLVEKLDLWEDSDEPDEPEEGDYVWDDAKNYLSIVGERGLGNFEDQDAAETAAVVDMKKNNFYPSFWSLSDHGNYALVSITGISEDALSDAKSKLVDSIEREKEAKKALRDATINRQDAMEIYRKAGGKFDDVIELNY